MNNAVNNAGVFLISSLFDLYITVLMIRIILLWARADYFNPLSQLIIKLTNPILLPLKNIFPKIGGIEIASVFYILLFEIIKFYLIGLLTTGMPNILGILILSFADSLKILLNIFFYAILLQAILSWVQGGQSAIMHLLFQITMPLMRPFQRLIPPVSGFDLSPIPAMLMLQVIIILIVSPLINLGSSLAFF